MSRLDLEEQARRVEDLQLELQNDVDRISEVGRGLKRRTPKMRPIYWIVGGAVLGGIWAVRSYRRRVRDYGGASGREPKPSLLKALLRVAFLEVSRQTVRYLVGRKLEGPTSTGQLPASTSGPSESVAAG